MQYTGVLRRPNAILYSNAILFLLDLHVIVTDSASLKVSLQQVYGRVCSSECAFGRIQLTLECTESRPSHAAIAE